MQTRERQLPPVGPTGAAIFDLDDTLLEGDSDYLFGEFLCDVGAVDADAYRAENARYLADYRAGTLDLEAFSAFALAPLTQHSPRQLHRWRAQFLETVIAPRVRCEGTATLAAHRARGDRVLVATATNRFITEPIAALVGARELLATELEMHLGRFSGGLDGPGCSGPGKRDRVIRWALARRIELAASCFYSDSRNDLPLLEAVGTPLAVNPDSTLAERATARGWRVLDWSR